MADFFRVETSIMTKKTLPSPFHRAQLKKNKVWYIEFLSEQGKRYRRTFSLNRKKFLQCSNLREQVANELLLQVNMSIPFGYPERSPLLSLPMAVSLSAKNFEKSVLKMRKKKKKTVKVLSIEKAFSAAIRAKSQLSGNDDTIRKYLSHQKLFFRFLEKKGWLGLPVKKFKAKHAVQFMDYREKKDRVGVTTWNNSLRDSRTMFAWMMQKPRNWVKKNPFSKEILKYKTKTKLSHSIISAPDARTIANYIFEQDKPLFLALLVQYIGFARPKEIRRLRRSDFCIKEGYIRVTGIEGTKTEKDKFLTIPDEYKPIFEKIEGESWFSCIAPDWFVWGRLLRPNKKITCGERSMSNLHKKYIRNLYEAGQIASDKYQWYDWKRRGITNALDDVKLLHVQEQANHTKPETTLIYRHPERINRGMLERKNDLLGV